jgi:hypothetical protein
LIGRDLAEHERTGALEHNFSHTPQGEQQTRSNKASDHIRIPGDELHSRQLFRAERAFHRTFMKLHNLKVS